MLKYVTYDGKDVFDKQLDPLVGKTTAFVSNGDNRVLLEETISLAGELTGCGRDELITARNDALEVFSESFKDLEIDGIGTFEKVKVQSIDFDQSPYLASLPYTITMLHYPEGGYEFGHGVSDPVCAWTYTENTNQTVSIQHQVSAKGINTSSTLGGNALDNAKDFVQDLLVDADKIPRPALIDTTDSDFSTYIVDFSETIDKINNTISISRTFETDPTEAIGNVILRYTSNIEGSEGEEILITHNGTVDAGREGEMQDARDKYTQFRDGLEVARFMTENITEDEDINNISFSFSHISGNKDPNGMVDDFTISLEETSDTSLFSASINGNISTRGRCIGAAWDKMKAIFGEGTCSGNANHNLGLCQDIYDDFYTTEHGSCQKKPMDDLTLHQAPISRSVGYNEYAQTISYNTSYNDRLTLGDKSSSPSGNCTGVPTKGLHTWDYTMNFTPSLPAIKSVASAYNNGWIFEDLMYRNRCDFSISMNARSLDGENDLISKEKLHGFGEDKFHKMVDDPEDEVVTNKGYVLNNQWVASATWATSFHSNNAFVKGECEDPLSYTGIETFEL